MSKIKNLMIDKMNEEAKHLSADDLCPICNELSNENGRCECEESWENNK